VSSGGENELGELLARAYRYALALTHDESRAADLLQEACLAVVKAKGSWNRGYLFAAVRTRHLNQVRRAHLIVVEPLEDPDLLEGHSSGDPLEASDPFELRDEDLEAALGILSDAQREALFLTVVEGYTAGEIGDLTGRPRGTILSLIHRARHKLRAHLGSREEVQA